MKILLVEDDVGTAENLRTTLLERHYLVDLAVDGQVRLEMAEAFTYDLILLDVVEEWYYGNTNFFAKSSRLRS